MSTPTHLGGAYPEGDGNTWMPDVWGYLIVKYNVKTVLDIGCGYGHAMKWFSEFLVHAVGIEGDPNAVNGTKLPGHSFLHDFTLGRPPERIIKRADLFDLAWSAEFLEHVEERFIQNYMDAFRQCRFACVTHAEPGQVGHHHVNCQTDDYWIHQFAQAGFIHDPKETEILRRTDRWKAGWGRRTLMFFKRL